MFNVKYWVVNENILFNDEYSARELEQSKFHSLRDSAFSRSRRMF